jgi:hypothetical protein
MIDVTVDGHVLDARQLEMHYQEDPWPGGSTYALRIVDAEVAALAAQDVDGKTWLTQSETKGMFNLLRPLISMRLGRLPPLYWANTIDRITITDDTLELHGVCSPHVT